MSILTSMLKFLLARETFFKIECFIINPMVLEVSCIRVKDNQDPLKEVHNRAHEGKGVCPQTV